MTTDQQESEAHQRKDTLIRQWKMLRMIPRYPSKFCSSALINNLNAAGLKTYEKSILTIYKIFGSLILSSPTHDPPGAAALDK